MLTFSTFRTVLVAVAAVEWLDMARIVRGQTLSIKRQEYVQAAEALGVRSGGVLARHVIPNTLGPVIVYVTLLVPRVILLESFLSFLGLGAQPPTAELGSMAADGRKFLTIAPHVSTLPCALIFLMVLAFNVLGDAARDALDPQLRQ